MFSYKKALKTSKNMLYSPLKKCTWRFKIRKMINSNYILLYGIRLFGTKIGEDRLKNEIVSKRLNLWDDWRFVRNYGKKLYAKAAKKKEFNGIEDVCNIYAVVIHKKDILNTFDNSIVNYVKANSNKSEQAILEGICQNKKLGVYRYPHKIRLINEHSRLLETIEPPLYKITSTDSIVDIAIGEKGINDLISKYTKT